MLQFHTQDLGFCQPVLELLRQVLDLAHIPLFPLREAAFDEGVGKGEGRGDSDIEL